MSLRAVGTSTTNGWKHLSKDQLPSRRVGLFKRNPRAAAAGLAMIFGLIGLLALPGAADPGAEAQVSEAVPVEAAVTNAMEAGGTSDFWVVLRASANTSAAPTIKGWGARGNYVYDQLTTTAETTQAPLVAKLKASGVEFQSFWIANAVLVQGASQATLDAARSAPGVREIRAPRTYQIETPTRAADGPHINAIEWGIAAINADDVWSTFGVRGEGIVVANIDTGTQFDHPALVGKYRGNLGGGSFDHNYNWFDPSNVCGNPSLVPCDNNGHGSHTMGTMVGDDGGANQIGVAPGARWMAAKGCETNNCSDAALLASGQWILAPTNLAGQNPRPDLRPNIVNNSWGGGGNDFWYQATVSAWRAAGIFPAFSNGNSGPACDTAGSPGDYTISYATGAFDINGSIATFSARGPGQSGELKPNLAAPGVDVRSSVPGNGYAGFNGTSMASPHTAGTVALMWSADPSLVGDIVQTEALLDDTAIDVSDLQCGGTADDNHVWGEGRLDAFAAVDQGPRTLSIDDVSVQEGNAGTTNATFTVTLSRPSSNATTVTFQTIDGTATAPSDYVNTSGTLTFPPTVLTQQVAVPVNGDTIVEPDETFTVTLSSPSSGTTIGDGTGVGTIVNDDFNSPPIAVNDEYTTAAGVTLTVPAPGVLANDSDPDGDPLTAQINSLPANGTVNLAANGSFTYTPAAGFTGTDTFTYRASDGQALSAPATVTIRVHQYRVDAHVQAPGGNFIGDNIYNSTGANQTASAFANRGKTITYRVRIQNDSPTASDTFRVRGSDTGGKFFVCYFDAGVDVTPAVRAGTFTTPALAPGTSRTLQVTVTVLPNAPLLGSNTATLVATSAGNPSRVDVVKARTSTL